jgi:hypothetical protein
MTDREWKFSIWDITRAIEHIKSASGRIEKLDSLVTNRPELPDSLSTEEKKTIEASLEANDSLSDAIQILSILRNDIRREAGEDSEDDEGDY